MILAAIVFTVALNNRGGVMTDEKVIVRAWELGMVMADDTEEETEGSTQSLPDTKNTESTESTQNTESIESTE
jgi:hypothetical protein